LDYVRIAGLRSSAPVIADRIQADKLHGHADARCRTGDGSVAWSGAGVELANERLVSTPVAETVGMQSENNESFQ
jgi:hypothetical protein